MDYLNESEFDSRHSMGDERAGTFVGTPLYVAPEML
jgi:hypothetical protein